MPVSRRQLLTRFAATAAATVVSGALAGCVDFGSLLPTGRASAARRLTVCLLGGASPPPAGQGIPDALDIGDPLLGLAEPLRAICARQQTAIRGVGAVVFQAFNASSPWFPLPPRPGEPQPIVDDATIPMADVVIAPHHVVATTLAVRALDLGFFLRQSANSGDLAGIPSLVWRQGRAYASGRGTFQAALPLLRNPLVCLVPQGTAAVQNGHPWTVEEFAASLDDLTIGLAPPGTVLPFVPYGSGVAEMAAVGSGGILAVTTPSACAPAFDRGATAAAISQTVEWVRYASATWLTTRCVSGYQYRMLLLTASAVLSGPPQIPQGGARPSDAWSIAPPPAFSARPAIPLNNVDVLVWRDSLVVDQALEFASHLLSTDGQAALAPFGLGLALRPEQAVRDIPRGAQGAGLITVPEHDITAEDAYGTETDANHAGMDAVRVALQEALRQLTGVGGGFYETDRYFAAQQAIEPLPGMTFNAEGAPPPSGGPPVPSCRGYIATPPPSGDASAVLAHFASAALAQ